MVVLIALAVFGCLSRPSAGTECHKMEFGGTEREYCVHFPSSQETKPMPVVIVLHGGAGNALEAEGMTGMSSKADKEEFIAVYPQGSSKLKSKALTWNSGNCCGYALEKKIDDIGFMRALIEKHKKDSRVDGKRIYVTGISDGGMLTYMIGCELADEVAAIAPVAGALNYENCSPGKPLPIVIFHSTDDEHVLYGGGKPIQAIDPTPRTDASVAYAFSFWSSNNGCIGEPSIERMGNVSIKRYDDCTGAPVVLYSLDGGGHAWPGGKNPGFLKSENTGEISATDIMWEFFKSQGST